MVLAVMLTVLAVVYITGTDADEQAIVALVACVSLGPLLLVTIAFYIYARSRDERLEAEAWEAQQELLREEAE